MRVLHAKRAPRQVGGPRRAAFGDGFLSGLITCSGACALKREPASFPCCFFLVFIYFSAEFRDERKREHEKRALAPDYDRWRSANASGFNARGRWPREKHTGERERERKKDPAGKSIDWKP